MLWFGAALLILLMGLLAFRVVHFIMFVRHHPNMRHSQSLRFEELSSSKLGPKAPAASGNSDVAEQMAAEMSKRMAEIRALGFTQAKEKSWLDEKDVFKTYCDLRSNQCVFLIHVPEMRNFETQARADLGKVAWQSAELILDRHHTGRPGMKIAVGMVGVVFYDRVMRGHFVTNRAGVTAGLEDTTEGPDCDRKIYDWLVPETTNVAPEIPSPQN